MQAFFEACVEAGPAACALHAPSPAAIAVRLRDIATQLQSHPISVISSVDRRSYGLVDYRLLRQLLLGFVYAPYGPRMTAHKLSVALAAAEAGDGRPLWDLSRGIQAQFHCRPCNDHEEPVPGQSIEAAVAITCGEADAVDDTFDELQSRFAKAVNISSFAELIYLRLFCS
jgi:hypothetical protein